MRIFLYNDEAWHAVTRENWEDAVLTTVGPSELEVESNNKLQNMVKVEMWRPRVQKYVCKYKSMSPKAEVSE